MKIKEPSYDLNQLIFPWLSQCTKRTTYLILNALKEHGVDRTREQMIILKHLTKTDGLVQNDLAFITDRDKTSLTRIINTMEKKGLLKRVQCKDDQRRNRIYITQKGKQEFKKGFPIVKNMALRMQDGLTPEEIESTIKVLKKVSQNLIELEDEKK